MSPLTAFDSDVLISAATPGHPLGAHVVSMFSASRGGEPVGIGSVLLMPETLTKPLGNDDTSAEAEALRQILSRLDLRPLDEPTARLTPVVAVQYGLHASDATHLATAIADGADRFLTNNRHDFPRSISEIDVIYPEDLPEA